MNNDRRVRTKPIAALWGTYRLILPTDASTTQITVTRRAFYAGAQALFSSIMINLEPDHEPTENDLLMMDDIHEELRAFMQHVINGVA